MWSTTNGSTHVNGDTTASISGLGAGQYTVLMVALNGDSATSTCTIFGAVALELNVAANAQGNHIACEGDTAVVNLTATGGVPPYTYLWEGGLFSQHMHTTAAGMKRVRVWDSYGCTADDSVVVVMAEPMEVNAAPFAYPNGQAFSCDTCNDGMIIIHAIGGGVSPYTIAWSTGATGDTLYGIHADSLFGLTVTDAQGCTDGGEMTLPRGQLDEIFNMEVSATLSHYAGGYQVSCHGCANGGIQMHVTGGVPPYHFAWSTGDTLAQLDSLTAGIYTVVVTDSYMSEEEVQLTLFEPSHGLGVMIASRATRHPAGMVHGGLQAETTGGTPPYVYAWQHNGTAIGATWAWLSIGQWGSYTLKVTDASGQTATDSLMVDSASTPPMLPPIWGAYGNNGTGGILEGVGAPWFGTGDSTDVVMKANGVPQLRLGANGVTSVEGQLRLVQLQGAQAQGRHLLVVDEFGSVAKWDGGGGWPVHPGGPASFCDIAMDPVWYSGTNKLYVPCPHVNVGIGTETPESKLDVRGQTYSQTLSVGTYAQDAKVTIKGGSQQSGKALEVQKSDGSPALQVLNNGNVGIGTNAPEGKLHIRHASGETALQVLDDRLLVRGSEWNSEGDRSSIELGDFNQKITGIAFKGLSFSTWQAEDAMIIAPGGKVGIGVGDDHTFGEGLLEVNGTIRANKFVAEIEGWPDFVFQSEYKLRPLKEVEEHIHAFGHLPDVPSAKELEEGGIDLGELIRLQMQKIEELTLYVIDLEKRLNEKCAER